MRYVVLLLVAICLAFTTQVAAQCTVNAGHDTLLCGGASTTLNPVVTGNSGGVSYSWTPATGLSATNIANPVATPATTTSYIVTISGGGCNTIKDTIKILAGPIPTAGFNITNPNGCSSTAVNFTNTSVGGSSYSWNFGNPASGGANTSNSGNPSHAFVAPGNGNQSFPVKLIVTSNVGCKDSITQSVTVKQSPDAELNDFVNTPPYTNCGNGTFALIVDNTSTTTATNTYYKIDWGDGSPILDTTTPGWQEATHTYTTAGYFTLIETVTGQNGCTANHSYTVFNGSNPAGGLVNPGATTNLCPPTNLVFGITGTQNNPPGTIYIITINDGSPPDTLPHPPPATYAHIFTSTSCGASGGIIPNSYYIRMRIENPCGFSVSNIEPITFGSKSQSKFTTSPDTVVCVNTPVTHTNTSVAAVTIDVNGNCQPGTKINWIISPSTGWILNSGTFGSNPPTNNPATWGSNTMGITYNTPGVYNLSLITDGSGSYSCGKDTVTHQICVQTKPTASFVLNQTTGCAPYNINATNTTVNPNSCGYLNYNWQVNFISSPCNASGAYSFTGGTTASSVNPSFQFTKSGTYQIILQAITGCGISADTQLVIIKDKPQIALSPIPDTCGTNVNINPTQTSLSCLGTISGYNWAFTGGTPSASASAIPGTIIYASQGTYTVALSVTNECGTTNTSTTFHINPGPSANAGNDTTICLGQSVTLGGNPTATGGNGTYVYSWTPLTGLNNATFSNPLATPATKGIDTFVVAVTSNSCTVHDTIKVTVDTIPIIHVNSGTVCAGKSDTLEASGAANYVWTPNTYLNINTGDTVVSTPPNTAFYTVKGTDGNGCSATASTSVSVNQLPTVNAGLDKTMCNQNITVTFTGTPTGGTWTGTAITTGGVFNPQTAGIGTWPLVYHFTDANGCTNTDTAIATVNATVFANAGNGKVVCINNGLVSLSTLGATPSGGTWSGRGIAGTNFDPVAAGVGNDTITYTYGTGTCLTTDTAIMTVNPKPTVTVNSGTICAGKNTTLIANGASTYSWSPPTNLSATTGTSVIASPTNNITYAVIGTDANGCTASATSTITVNQLPIVNAGIDITLCNQNLPDTVVGTPAGGNWSGTAITPTGYFNPSVAGLGPWPLVYTYTDANSCTNTDTLIATVINPTNANAGSGYAICINSGNVNLNNVGATPPSGTWSGRGVTGTVFNPTAAGVGSDTLTYTFGAGTCLTSDTIIMTIHGLPSITANSGTICDRDSIQLTANGGVSYIWTPPSGLNSSNTATVIASPGNTTTYIITGTDANGCSSTTTSTVTVNTRPATNAGSDTAVCLSSGPITFNGNPAGGTWSGTGITAGGIFTAATAGAGAWPLVYSFTNAQNCTGIDTMIVTVTTPTAVDAGTGFSICQNAVSVSLNNTGATPAGGTWSGSGVAGTNFNPNRLAPGVYILTYAFTGCASSDTIRVTVNGLPTVTANSATLCFGQSATLTANGANTYSWAPPTALSTTTGVTVTANPTTTTAYAITGTDINGCSSTGTSTVTVNQLPIVNAGVDTSMCNQAAYSIQLVGSPANGTWTGSLVSGGGLFTPTGNIADTGIYVIRYHFTDGNGCTDSSLTHVHLITPIFANAGPSDTVCITNAAAILPRFSPAGGTWSGSGIANSFTGLFNPAVAGLGSHTLTYTYGIGNCVTTSTRTEVVVAPPSYTFNPVAPVTCFQAPITLTISGNDTYTWAPSTGLNATSGNTVIAILNTSETITVTANNSYGCSVISTLNVQVNPLPIVTAGNDTSFCNTAGSSIQLHGTPAGGSWTGTRMVTATGLFTATGNGVDLGAHTITYHYTDGNGCTDSNTVHITLNAPVFAHAGTNDTFCLNTPAIQLQGFSPATGGTWAGNGITGPSNGIFDPGVAGVGTQTLYYNYGTGSCATVDSITAYVRPLPHASFTFAPVCVGQATWFTDASTFPIDPITTWYWDFGDNSFNRQQNPPHSFSTGGTYIVNLTVTDNKGCSDDTSISYIASPFPNVNFLNPQYGCLDSAIHFGLNGSAGAQYHWDFGDGQTGTGANPTHVYASNGTFHIKLVGTSANGCMDSATSSIFVSPAPSASFVASPKMGCGPLKVVYHYIPGAFPSLNYNFTWIMGNGDTLFTPVPDTITYQPGRNGDTTYYVTLYVQSLGCQQIAIRNDSIRVIKGPVAHLAANINTLCSGVDVQFTVTGEADSFKVDFGDGLASSHFFTPRTVNHTFTNNSIRDTTYLVRLAGMSRCGTASDSLTITVRSGLLQAGMDITPSDNCMGKPFTVTNTSTGADYIYYDLGHGKDTISNTASSFTFTIADSGVYSIYQYVYSGDSCKSDKAKLQVQVHNAPHAAFTEDTKSKECNGPVQVLFNNQSQRAITYYWAFGDGQNSTDENPLHDYHDAGNYHVMLMASNEYSCTDTANYDLSLVHKLNGLYVPNAFSPGFGEPAIREFKPAGLCLATYHIRIFNTWGELMWESEELENQQPAKGWDGTYQGKAMPQDVYVWKIDATFTDNQVWDGKDYNGTFKKIGSVTLLR